MKEFDRFTTMLAFSIGQIVLASMFYPLGLLHGCPRLKKGGTAQGAAHR